MAYTIYQSDGTPIIVADNAIDAEFYNSTGGGGSGLIPVQTGQGQGIQLVGRNTLDYGAAIAQNFLQITENFCSSAQPIDEYALQGQLWFSQASATNGSLYVRVNQGGVGNVGIWEQLVTTSGTINYTNNLVGGLANQIPVQTAPSTTSFLPAPTTASTFLEWNGTSFVWATVADATDASNILGGALNEILYQTGPAATSFITAPSSPNTFLTWSGSAFVWTAATTAGVSSFNTRTGAVTLTSADVTTALGYTPPQPNGTGASGTWSITAASANALNTGNNYQVNSLGVGTGASGTSGEIRATNNITAYYSDKRLKNISGNITGALSKVNLLNGILFTNNKLANKFGYTNTDQQVGVIAQEVKAVLPEAVCAAPFDIERDATGFEVSKSGENYLTVQYEKLVPLLIEAIKEMSATIDDLKAKVNSLENK